MLRKHCRKKSNSHQDFSKAPMFSFPDPHEPSKEKIEKRKKKKKRIFYFIYIHKNFPGVGPFEHIGLVWSWGLYQTNELI